MKYLNGISICIQHFRKYTELIPTDNITTHKRVTPTRSTNKHSHNNESTNL